MIILEREKDPFYFEQCRGPVRGVLTNMKENTRRDEAGLTPINEEQGTFWVFVWPKLVPWNYDISWLFCPITRSGWKVGDLWGVDERGELLIVENKTTRNDKSPFEEFVNHRSPAFEELQAYWLERLRMEEAFRKTYPQGLDCNKPLRSKSDSGIAPASVRWMELQRWPDLDRKFFGTFSEGNYENITEQYLSRYNANPRPPHYVGLFTLFEDDEVPRHAKSCEELVKLVGKDRVLSFAVRRFPETCWHPAECSVQSYRVHLRES